MWLHYLTFSLQNNVILISFVSLMKDKLVCVKKLDFNLFSKFFVKGKKFLFL